MQPQEPSRRLLLRTEATAKAYEDFQKITSGTDSCGLCDDPLTITEYKFWLLANNRFPYDRYFGQTDMLITKRHVDETGLTAEEKAELFELKKVLTDDYDLIFENLPKQRSVLSHMHYHLVKMKRPE